MITSSKRRRTPLFICKGSSKYGVTPNLSRVHEQKAAAGDLDAIKILQGISPVAWRTVHS
jgi:hypothetical protein